MKKIGYAGEEKWQKQTPEPPPDYLREMVEASHGEGIELNLTPFQAALAEAECSLSLAPLLPLLTPLLTPQDAAALADVFERYPLKRPKGRPRAPVWGTPNENKLMAAAMAVQDLVDDGVDRDEAVVRVSNDRKIDWSVLSDIMNGRRALRLRKRKA